MINTLRQFLLSALLLSVPGSIAIAQATDAGAVDPATQYRVLQWHELVPENWEPPLVPPAHDTVASSGVDPAAVVSDLDQRLVSLPGYMRPMVFQDNQVSEFLLVPYLPHHLRQHAHLEANQMVYVSLLEPLRVEQPLAPIWVVGTMTTGAVFTDEGLAAYSIVDALVTEYEY